MTEASVPNEPARGLPILAWVLMWVAGSAMAAWLFFDDYLKSDGWVIDGAVVWGRDFINVWTGGKLALGGNLGLLYDLKAYGGYQRDLFGPITAHNYSYPPTTLFVAAPLALLPYPAALALWLAGTAALFLLAARPYVRGTPRFPLVLAILTPAAMINIWSGHYGFLIGALWLACFSALEQKPGRAGAAAAVLTVKPHLGILLSLVMIGKARWGTVVVAVLGTALLVAASGIVFGWGLWRGYLIDASAVQAHILNEGTGFFRYMMPTALLAGLELGVPEPAAWAIQAVFALLAVGLCVWAIRRSASFEELAFITATATFLVLPYAFNYDMTVAALGFALLLQRKWAEFTLVEGLLMLLAFLSPQTNILLSAGGLPLTPLVLLGALAVQVRHCGAAKAA